MISFISGSDIKIEKKKDVIMCGCSVPKKYGIKILFNEDCLLKMIVKNEDSYEVRYKCKNILKENDEDNKVIFSIFCRSGDVVNYESTDKLIFKNIYIEKKLLFIKKFNFENVFVINLKENINRKETMIERMEAIGCKYEFIEGEYDKSGKTGHEGCYNSHVKCLKIGKNRGYENIIILEDDVFFCDDFLDIVENMLLPKNYNMLYFGGITTFQKMFFGNICPINNFYVMGAYAYMVNKNFLDTLIDVVENNDGIPIDQIYVDYVQKCYRDNYIMNDVIMTTVEDTNTSRKTEFFYKNFEKTKKKYEL